MSLLTFDDAFAAVIGVEGGYVNDPADPGGATKYGISKRAHPAENIAALTLDRAKAIYRASYWDKCLCDQLPPALAALVFDAAVNQGCDAAIRMLQKTLGVVVDGWIGPATLGAAAVCGRETPALYLAERGLRYCTTSGFDRFGRGWFKRLFVLAAEVAA